MKKRLLSAVLALAMALTLLPMSVFADEASPVAGDLDGDGTETVTYQARGNGTTYPDGAGWYVTHSYKDGTGKVTSTANIKVTEGVSVGGKYYSVSNFNGSASISGNTISNPTGYNYSKASDGSLVKTGLKGAVIVIGGTVDIDAVNAGSLTIGVFGGSVSVSQTRTGTNATATNPTLLTSLTINNTYYTQAGLTLDTAGTVTSIPTSVNTLSLTNVQASNVTFTRTDKNATNGTGVAHKVELTNATLGAVTLSGVGGGSGTNAAGNAYNDTNVTHAVQTVTVNGGKIGNIQVTGNNSTVTLSALDPSSNPTVSLTGTNTTLNVKGGSTVGDVTIQGANSSTVKTGVTTVAARPANVTVDIGCTVGKIEQTTSGELCTSANQIIVNGTVSGAVTMKNATINVSGGGGNTGDITLETGTVNVSGNRATVGGVTLAHNATFNLTGNNCTVGALTVGGTKADATTVTFNVPADVTNSLTSVDSNYKKHTIKGGTWTNAVAADALDSSLVYQLSSSGKYTYYNADQLGEAVLKQAGSASNTLTVVGQSSASNTVTFKNGSITWGVLTAAPNTTIPKLPTQMNSVNTPKWSDGNNSSLSGLYNTPKTGTNVVLDAGGGGAVTGDATKLTGVSVTGANIGNDIRARLNGNVITLTGAVESGQTNFTLKLETDAVEEDSTSSADPKPEIPVVIEVGVTYNPSTKILTFDNPGTDGYALSNGVVVENTFLALKLANGTRYTLNGSGLVLRSNTIKVEGIDDATITNTTGFSANNIEVNVSAPGYTSTQVLKDQIIALINDSDAEFDFSDSPAMKQAINAALASITDTQVASWKLAAQRRAWSDNRTDAYNASTSTTAYDTGEVVLVPYLLVNVTSYQPTTSTIQNASLTATLTPMWRVEVRPATGSSDYKVKDANNLAKNGVYIAKAGTALTGIAGDLTKSDGTGGVSITFKNGVDGATYAHQDNTYDYKITSDAFTVTHAGNNGLGTFVLNAVEPLVKLGTKPSTGTEPGGTQKYYSSLQAAVDDAKDGEYILVDSAYTGSTTINMTGTARTIYVQANGKNVVVANASGGLVSENNTGSLYTIKLNRDNTVSVSTDIIVGTVDNGTAVPDVVKAKQGQTVTVTVTPKQGYTGAVTAKTNSGAAVPVTNNGNNTFTFTVPANATRVDVTPEFKLASALPFTDVAATANYYNAVKYCYEKGMIQGTTSTTFAPNSTITRAQIVTILWRQAGAPRQTPAGIYKDMPGNSDYYNAIIWATNNNIAQGYEDGKFYPDRAINRQELATFLYRYQVNVRKGTTAGSVNNLNSYTDGGEVGLWAQPAMRWAVGNGIVSASGSRLTPKDAAPRWQAATAMYMYCSGVLGIV